MEKDERNRREKTISLYLQTYLLIDDEVESSDDSQRLELIRAQVLALISEGDEIASRIRERAATARY
ncbi:hypothetical protein [Sandaracinobacter sp.]|jgi:hypothetical protein|uniref:hypothetical protein n=1 Tax=Sandaracinobacter sp. TaxID=2487581 RepID=UPI0035AE2421